MSGGAGHLEQVLLYGVVGLARVAVVTVVPMDAQPIVAGAG
ncbi:hypothetical protein [Streptomyces sp. NPDC005970]